MNLILVGDQPLCQVGGSRQFVILQKSGIASQVIMGDSCSCLDAQHILLSIWHLSECPKLQILNDNEGKMGGK